MSRRPALAAAVAVALAAAACRHPRTASEGAAPQEKSREAAGAGPGGGLPAEPGRPRVPASPSGLLAKGAIAELQRALAGRGLLGEHREGELDAATNAAIRRFQEQHRLAATGFPDRETVSLLGLDPEKIYVRPEDRKRAERGTRERDPGARPAP